ncbi:hypothetical protein DZF91_12545 [Actinomadura logoneensis]|uniref:Holliday junction resolvase RuvC n=1 Tax=Actinomadura logoneensis TaxID=2293572 RepID=A0A372JMY0_9ACTN|nr:hypothetical protein [Actinomadura logoneensis]RFU41309.1 hypothetical protein DZF91_12545 [Actinomadura logoneensis]
MTGGAAGPAVLGIDPGRRWTAGVLRVGDRPWDGWTLGPVDAEGRPDPSATDNADDLAAFARYQRRVLDMVEATVDRHREAGGGPVYLACEVTVPPAGRRIALADWLIPRQLVAGLLAYDPGLVLVRADQHGRAHYDRDAAGRLVRARPLSDHYPPAFWPTRPGDGPGGRPAGWGPCEARRGERDHERAAWDIAGAGARILARRAERSGAGV